MKIGVYKVSMARPDDLGGLKDLIEKGTIKPAEIIAVIAKTEGNGNVNDFTRGFTTLAIQDFLSDLLDCRRDQVGKKVSIVCSGGCEGVMSPHATIFTKSDAGQKDGKKRLAVGVKNTRDLLPEEFGTSIHSREVAEAVHDAILDAGIDNPSDVHFVQIKCPLLTSDRINDAEKRGEKVVTKDTLKSMAFSRGASALGIAMALGEVEGAKVTDSVICNDWSLYSNVASTSAGIELMNNEIIVMGNSADSSSDFVIGHSAMQDPIDADAVRSVLKNVGIDADPCVSKKDSSRLVNVFAKAGAHPSGTARGRRTTMLTDSDISSTRHVRAVVNAVIACIVGDPMVYVSGGSEHQGPLGGGPIAAIARI